MEQALVNARVLDVDGFSEGQGVVLSGGRIAGLVPLADLPARMPRTDLGGAILAPGFVDVQVNGGGAVMFNSDRSVDGLRRIAAAHRAFGTTTLLPTLITDTPGVMLEAASAMRGAIAAGVPGVRGIHFEGPCLSPTRPGVHDPDLFRPLDDEMAAIYSGGGMGTVHVTLAPEQAEPARIAALAAAGVIVSAGHTDADHACVTRALSAGLRGFTHLFNAMSPFTSRAPGCVGAALDADEAWCGLIVDGYHVHDASARVAVTAKPRGKVMLVTDAMGTVGAADKRFTLYGRTIRAENGRCALPDGTLAGSDLDMAGAVRGAVHRLGLPLAEALRMASLYPARFLRLDDRIGRIAPGFDADLVALDPEALTVRETWIAGVPSAVAAAA